jgi:hypothetical protein
MQKGPPGASMRSGGPSVSRARTAPEKSFAAPAYDVGLAPYVGLSIYWSVT